ncbi:MAG: ABC transporter permease, partial [Bacteroides xylanisolvens]
YNSCHYNYPEVMGIKIIEGTTLKKQNDLLVNEELVRLMKWTDGAVGKTVNDIQGTIVGVFRDIRNNSFYGSQSPIVLIGDENANHAFDVRLKEPYNENLKRLNEFVENTYPNISLRFILVDYMVKDIYKDVYRFRNSVWITSAFILLIVIMGLIGYVNDETQRRSKEIAIRKVNGAEASHILGLLTRDILYVSVISILVGTTVSYFAGQAWLDQFAEQIDLNPLLFAATALFVQLLIVICVVLKAWHIANENPVNSIKAE